MNDTWRDKLRVPDWRAAARRFGAWQWMAIAIAAAVILLLLMEGIFSIGNALVQTWRDNEAVPMEHRQTDHDPLLGWVVESNLSERDFYGDWTSLTTNDSGHRIAARNAPTDDNARRLICIGGSGTFGVGVGDAATWCARLGAASSGYVSVNAAQPGHGLGQAWLTYRDKLDVPHDMVVVGLSTAMVNRLFAAEHHGYPKPWLGLSDNAELQVHNTPVPLRPYLWPWATANADHLSQAWLFKPWFVEPEQAEVAAGGLASAVMLGNVVSEIRQLAADREVKLALVYLPSVAPGVDDAMLRNLIAGASQSSPGVFVDLAGAAQALSANQRSALFSGDQLSVFGHLWVARQLRERLGQTEAFADLAADAQPWYARFYANTEFTRQAGESWFTQSSLSWGSAAPVAGAPNDGFSAVLDSCLSLDESLQAHFLLVADGHAGLTINRQLILETGNEGDFLPRSNVVELPAGTHHLRLRYIDEQGPASIVLKARFNDGPVEVLGPQRLHPPSVSAAGLVCSGG